MKLVHLTEESATIHPMDGHPRQPRKQLSTPAKVRVGLLLLVPYAGLCFPKLYARATPALFGFPFFYWYQFAFVVLTSILLFAAYRILKAR